MKRPTSILLALALVLCLGAAAFASGPGSSGIDGLPGEQSLDVLLNARGLTRYMDDVTDGSGDIEGPGFEAHVSGGIPADAVRLVVVPITDPDALAWFAGCAGGSWTSGGVMYAVFYEMADGTRLAASGVHMTVQIPAGSGDLNIFSVSQSGGAASLDFTAVGSTVSFVTDGRLYYGPVRRQAASPETAGAAPPTGDGGTPGLWLGVTILCAASLAGLAATARRRRAR